LQSLPTFNGAKENVMGQDELMRDEKLFGDFPHIPHSSWKHDLPEEGAPPAQRVDASEFWERLGL
jgi:hypothetical protein